MIPYSRQLIEADDVVAAIDALRGDILTSGDLVEEFEEELANYLGCKYVCVLNSATTALHVAYQVAQLKQDDEIITSPITFAATSNAAIMCGARPVFCDVKPDGMIDEDKVEELITPKTKAIVPIHYSGNVANLKKLSKIAKANDLLLIEDAAHAFGSEIDGQKVGSVYGDMAVFSFHAIKPITTCGEGGAIATNNKDFYEQIKLLRSHGMIKKDNWDSDMVALGSNYRLNDVACALGISQLKKLDNFIAKRERIAHYYDSILQNKTDLVKAIMPAKNIKSSRHLYTLLLQDENILAHKKEIFKEAINKGIGVQVHYKPTYQFTYYKQRFGEMSLAGVEDFYARTVSIPCNHYMTNEDTLKITNFLMHVEEKYTGQNQ